jgi:hypothetical protein
MGPPKERIINRFPLKKKAKPDVDESQDNVEYVSEMKKHYKIGKNGVHQDFL